jgi:hypothetical protein
MPESLPDRIKYEAAVLLSIATHPVLVFYGVCCYLAASGVIFPPFRAEGQFYNLSLILLVTVFIPVIGQYAVSRSLFMEERQQRLAPLLVTAASYLGAWGLFHLLAFPEYMLAFMLSLVIGLSGLYLVTRSYKLSVHTSAAGSMVALFFSCIARQGMAQPPCWYGASCWPGLSVAHGSIFMPTPRLRSILGMAMG